MSNECQTIVNFANEFASSTDMDCGCDVILATREVYADCVQSINSTVSAVILNGMHIYQVPIGNTITTGTSSTAGISNTESKTAGANGGVTAAATVAKSSSTDTVGTGLPQTKSGPGQIQVAGLAMTVIVILAGILLRIERARNRGQEFYY